MLRTYRVKLTGKTPLLMHQDAIEWADEMEAWKKNPANKTDSKAGDDRSPAYRWLGSLYNDGERIVLPTDNVMRALMEGGALVPTGKGQTTFKARTQSGCAPASVDAPLLVRGHEVPVKPYFDGKGVLTFDGYQELAASHGFMLFVKRARIGTSKHIRVRPRFDDWAATVELTVVDDGLTEQVLASILDMAGQYKGLMDWRPSSKTPGSYGMFTATVVQTS